jgi:hypothetical protein
VSFCHNVCADRQSADRSLATGRTIKIFHVVDEFTRESLADLVNHSIDADAVVACLDKIAGHKCRQPEFIRCDNEPELAANALRDWCRFGGSGATSVEPGSCSAHRWRAGSPLLGRLPVPQEGESETRGVVVTNAPEHRSQGSEGSLGQRSSHKATDASHHRHRRGELAPRRRKCALIHL